MGYVPSAFAFLLMIFAGWANRRQLIVIEFLQAENRLLKEGLRVKLLSLGRRVLSGKSLSVLSDFTTCSTI